MYEKFLSSLVFAAFLISGSAQAQQNCVQGAFVGGIFTCLVREPVAPPRAAPRDANQIVLPDALPALPGTTLSDTVGERMGNRNTSNSNNDIYLAGDRFKLNLGGSVTILPKQQTTATISCRESLGGKLVCDISTID